jgi:hypothetical protein
MPDCLTPTDLVALFDNTFSPEERAQAEEHLQSCANCRSASEQLRGTPDRQELRRTLCILLVGFFLGGPLLSLSVLTASVTTLLQNSANVYIKFPSLERPWLLRIDFFSPLQEAPFAVPLYLASVVSGTCLGLFLVWMLRPRSAWGDANLGLRAGLVAGVSMYLCGVGWAVILALTTVPSLQDMLLLANGYQTAQTPEPHPQEVIVEAYEDLAALPEKDRANALFTKIVADSVVGSGYAVWVGLAICLGIFVPVGIYQTMAAGYLQRQQERPWYAQVLPYFEVSLTGTSLVMAVVLLTMGRWVDPNANLLAVVPPLLMTGLAWLGVVRRWPIFIRWALLGGLVLTFASLFEWSWRQPPIIVLGADLAAVLALVSLYLSRGQSRVPAFPASEYSPPTKEPEPQSPSETGIQADPATKPKDVPPEGTA